MILCLKKKTRIQPSGSWVIFKKKYCILAENPDQHKQAIQKGISHPSDQYSSILNAVTALQKMGYLESKKAISQKNLKIELYCCTEMGLLYALGKNPDVNVRKVLTAYKTRNEKFNSFSGVYDELGKEELLQYFRDLVEFLPTIQREGIEKALVLL